MFIHNQTTFAEDEKIVLAGLGGPRSGVLDVQGLLAGTRVETARGWCAVESLSRGDQVYTYDGELRAVEKVERTFFDLALGNCAPEFLVHIPGGVLNTCSDVHLLGSQKILLEGSVVEQVIEAPAALIEARELCGFDAISWVRPSGIQQSIRLIFAEEEILWANTGLKCLASPTESASDFFPQLSPKQARQVIHQITGFQTTSDLKLAA